MKKEVLTGWALIATAAATASARRDYSRRDRLSWRTQALMWPAYALGAGVIASAAIQAGGGGPRTSRLAGTAMAGAGVIFFAAGARPFESFSQLAGRSTGGLSTGGIYRCSRNPQYVGNVLISAGAAIAGRSVPGAIFTAGAAVAYSMFVPAEEAHLERIFGEAYRLYRRQTPRWLGPRAPERGSEGRWVVAEREITS